MKKTGMATRASEISVRLTKGHFFIFLHTKVSNVTGVFGEISRALSCAFSMN